MVAYRGGGRRGRRGGDQRPQYFPGGGGGGGDDRRFVWPPPPSAPRQVPMGYPGPMVLPHQGAYGVPMAVYRPPGQAATAYRLPAPAPAASPPVSFSPALRASPVTIRAPPSSSSTTTTAAASSTTPAPPPRQQPAAPAAASSAPSSVELAKEVEKKFFASETALAPPAAAAQGMTAAAGADDEASSDVDLAPVSKKGLAHPARHGLATVGKKVMIRANRFLVNVADNNLFHYDVSINPESKSRATNREVLNELIKLHGKTSLGGKLPAYDGRKNFYTAGSLPFESEEFTVTLVDPEKKDKERAEREYKITICIAGRTTLYHLQQFLRGRQRDMPQETIQVLDVVLRESPSWNYVTVSRSFFSTTFGHRGNIGEGLECWRGYYQSLRPTQMGLSLNIDISATSFFKPVTIIKFVEEFLNMRDTSRPLSDRDRVRIKKALRGVRIETTHKQDQIRRYKITGITPMTPIPMSQLIFPIDDKGTRKTVVQYFWDKYNYSLKYGSWPCLQAGSDSRPVYLPTEVCKIVEGQRYSKKLNDRQVTNILRATCKRPQEREQSIRDMVLHNKYADDRFAQEFGIKVSSDLVTVPACVLPPPLLKYHDSGREKTCAPSVGQWNMINKKMINGGTIDNWTCLNFSRMRPEEVQRFCMDLTHMCNTTGMVVNPRPFVEVKSASRNHIENALRDVHRRATQMLAQQGAGNQLQLLIVILPEVSGSYGKIKRVYETDIGIVSQCCLPKHASRPNKQYLENVALKINVKVGGRNKVLKRAFVRNGIPFVSEVPTIIFGADVTHPSPGEDSASSIAAVVASIDWPEITKYRGLVSAQPHRQEIMEDLFSVSKDPQKGHNVNGGMIRKLLIAFRRKTNRRPERIIFYRDGVSEDQFSHVLLHEMDAIRKACAPLEEGYLPPVTFVVVQKRHHTRLFPEVHGRRDMTDKSGNILPGTVVDQMICHPTEFDFYLCSHAGIQGTSRPTHYHVLYDENHFTSDALQSLTNNLCYTYRWTHAVSVVPPAHYTFRVPSYLDDQSSDGVLSQEGPVEVAHTEDLFTAQEGDDLLGHESKSIPILIDVLDRKFYICVKKFSTLEFVSNEAIKKLKFRLVDTFVTCDGKSAEPDMIFEKECTVRFQHRLRGGSNIVNLRDYIDDLILDENWYERVLIPTVLRTYHANCEEVGLAPGAQEVFSLIAQLFEGKHSAGYCFAYRFGLDEMWYDKVAKEILVSVPTDNISQDGYINDEYSLKSMLDDAFSYKRNGRKEYPMHIRELVVWICGLKRNGIEYSSVKRRSCVFLNAAGLSACERNNQLEMLMNYYNHLSTTDNKKRFREALGEGCLSIDKSFRWHHFLKSKGHPMPSEMAAVYNYSYISNDGTPQHKVYPDNFHGRMDFSRCLRTHVKGEKATTKQVDAAIYSIAPRQLLDLREKLLLIDFHQTAQKWQPKPSSLEATGTPSSSEAAGTPSISEAADTDSHCTEPKWRWCPKRVGTASRPTVQTVQRWRPKQVNSKAAGTSASASSMVAAGPVAASQSNSVSINSGTYLDMNLSNIPQSNHIKIYEVFGFKTKPPN